MFGLQRLRASTWFSTDCRFPRQSVTRARGITNPAQSDVSHQQHPVPLSTLVNRTGQPAEWQNYYGLSKAVVLSGGLDRLAHQARCGGKVLLMLVGRCCRVSPNLLHSHQEDLALPVKRTRSSITLTMPSSSVPEVLGFGLPLVCQRAD